MPLLPRTIPLFRTRTRRVGFYAGTLLTAGAVFDYNNYNVLSRSIRTLLGGAYIVYLYKLTTPKNLYELNELHAEAARTVRDICLANEGLYIKLGQLISSMNSAVPPVVIDILKVLLDDAPKVDIAIVKNILSRELAGVERNQSEWLSKHTQRLADRDRFMARTKTLAKDRSSKIPEAVLYENLKAYREGRHEDKNNSSTKDNAAAEAASASVGGVEVKNNTSSIDPALAPYFLAFDEVPVASASIAQVHKAVIRDPATGEPVTVAVKILKPAIRTQIWYDCTCHSILTHAIEKLFHIPITHNNETIDRNLTRESDFYVEASHTDLLRECLKDKKDVYIPRVFYEYLTDQIMITEWVDAVKLSESRRIKNEILGKGIVSSKGLMTSLINAFNEMVFVHGAVNCDPHPANLMVRPHPRHIDTIRETKKRWEEEDQKYAKALEEYEAAEARGEENNGSSPPPPPHPPTTTSLRPALPSPDLRAPRHQLILIDHGLCVTIPDTFRYEYGLFFRSLLGRDVSELSRLVTRWGVADTDLFVTMTLQKPFSSKRTADSSSNASGGSDGKPAGFFDEMSKRGGRKYTVEELAAMQQMMKERLSKFLADEELMPKEMLFIGRSFNYLRAINKEFGAPVNRLKMSADCAFRTLEKARIESLDDLEMWERCGRKQDAYLAARKELKKDTFASDLSMLKRRIIIQMALLWLDVFQIFVTFYNTVVVPIIALPLTVTLGAAASASPSANETYHEAIYKKLRIGTMEDILEARESQMSEQMWGPGGVPVAGGEGGGAKMDFVPDIGVND